MKHGESGGTHPGSRNGSPALSPTVATPSPVAGSCAATTSTGTTTCRSPTDAVSESAGHDEARRLGHPRTTATGSAWRRGGAPELRPVLTLACRAEPPILRGWRLPNRVGPTQFSSPARLRHRYAVDHSRPDAVATQWPHAGAAS